MRVLGIHVETSGAGRSDQTRFTPQVYAFIHSIVLISYMAALSKTARSMAEKLVDNVEARKHQKILLNDLIWPF